MFLFLIIGVCLSQTEYLCGKGDRQSPIDVHDTFDAKYYKLELRFKDDALVGHLNDYPEEDEDEIQNIKYSFTDDPTRQIPEFRMLGHDPHGLMVGYKPTEFQLIAPGEHSLYEHNFDLELVIWGDLLNIYKNPNVRGALSIFFHVDHEATEENMTNFIFNVTEENNQLSLNMISLASQLSQINYYITYRGSETSGNCEEIVDRFLIAESLPITQAQFDAVLLSKYVNHPKPQQDTRKRRIVQGTLIVDDETSANYNPIYRFLSLTFIGFLFFLIFALFIKEQREKARLEQAKKFKGNN